MGWRGYRSDLLSALVAVAVASACTGVDEDEPTPQFVPAEQLGAEIAQAPPGIAGPTLRVVTYNTLFGLDTAILAADFVAGPEVARADVIALQESMRPAGEESDAAALAAKIGNVGSVFVPLNERDEGTEGISLVSRFPLRDIQVMQLAELVESGFLDVPASRVALAVTLDTERGPIRIINIHLAVVLNVPERILQVRPAIIDPTLPTVALGDFNTNDYLWAFEHVPLVPLSASAETSQADALDGYVRRIGYAAPTADFGNTWFGFPKNQRLDSIFTHDLVTGAGGVDRSLEFSDHRPVFLDITVPP